jgi:endonuclease I
MQTKLMQHLMRRIVKPLLSVAILSTVSWQAQALEMTKAVPQGNLSAALGQSISFTLTVSDAKDLVFRTSGGSGDVDMYVKKGSAPSNSSFDCRPYIAGNVETCSFATPGNATYYVRLTAYSAFSGVSLVADYTNTATTTPPPTTSGPTWSGYSTYYAAAIGKTGSALRSALHEAAARNHVRMSYAQVWDGIKYSDEDPNNSNNVILIYTGRSQLKTFTAATSNSQDAWNREHCWPKSHGFPSEGQWAHTDLHHLRAADVSVNSSRGNKDYDAGGTQLSEAPGTYTDFDSFEPRNAVKGDLARMMFYMAVRYDGGDTTGVGNLELQNATGTSGNFLGKLCTMVQWHRQDPVSTEEINRHARIVVKQKNRNPFVDNPDWVEQVFGAACP